MPHFGTRSRQRLDTCDRFLIGVCEEVVNYYDFTVLWGRRGQADQDEAFANGFSNKLWPDSKHNTPDGAPSKAIDIAPWHADRPHIRWENEREFILLAGRMLQAADFFSVKLRWGGDWDMDDDLYDFNKPFDLGHFELI